MPVGIKNNDSVKERFKKLNVSNAYKVVSSARKGVKPRLFYEFARSIKMQEAELARIINLSARTVSNYHDQQKSLGAVNGEHLLKLIALYKKGESIFGNIDEFNYWLRKAFWNSGEKPLDWIVTPGGVDLLMDELDKLAEGYPV